MKPTLSSMELPTFPSRAFTLVELMAVIAVLLVLAGLIFPALAKAKPASDLLNCQDNMRQIGRGFSLYSGDFREEICRTGGLDSLVQVVRPNKNYGPNQQWCMGDMSSAPGWTNTALIQDSLIYPYVRSLAAYRCPSDVSVVGSALGPNVAPKSRSVSVNCYLNPINPWSVGRPYRKQNDLILGPAMTWVAMDENPASINDGWLIHPPDESAKPAWVDYPASYHEQSANLVFADSHVENRRWTDSTLLNYGRNGSFGGPSSNPADYRWLQERTTIR